MEPIGQKILIPSSEELAFAGDLDDNSLEKLETRIFDETLDGVLSELHVGEDLIDDFVDEIEGSYSLKSENLTKNQLDSKNTSSEITSKEMVVPNIALEVLEESNKIFFHQHPHYDEIKSLLTDQINDELRDYANTRSN